MSGGYNDLIGEFKMAVSDVTNTEGWVMNYTYILTGIKGELAKCDNGHNEKG